MEHVAVLDWKAVRHAHRESSDEDKSEMLRGPEDVIVQMFWDQHAWDESGIVRIQDGRKDNLLEAIIEIRFQGVDLRSDRNRIRRTAVHRHSVDTVHFRVHNCPQELFQVESENSQVQHKRIGQTEQI